MLLGSLGKEVPQASNMVWKFWVHLAVDFFGGAPFAALTWRLESHHHEIHPPFMVHFPASYENFKLPPFARSSFKVSVLNDRICQVKHLTNFFLQLRTQALLRHHGTQHGQICWSMFAMLPHLRFTKVNRHSVYLRSVVGEITSVSQQTKS